MGRQLDRLIIIINVVHEVQNKYKHKIKAKRKAKKNRKAKNAFLAACQHFTLCSHLYVIMANKYCCCCTVVCHSLTHSLLRLTS